jgi:tetratricopeptide (TPR) repeat protein
MADAMPDNIFINYRRQDTMSTAGRLHDRLSHEFGKENVFMDVDHIPAGVDFAAHLNSQVATCKILLVVIGSHWLDATDEAGNRRLHQPDDFVAIEIAAALARNVRVIPVLVDGAVMPKARELPDSLKPLARRQAVDVRQLHFGRDTDALLGTIRELLNDGPGWLPRRRWRSVVVGGLGAVTLLLIGLIAILSTNISMWVPWSQTREAGNAKAQADAAAKRKADNAEPQRIAAAKADNEPQARYSALVSQGDTDANTGNYDRAIATLSEAIRLNPSGALAFYSRGMVYGKKGDYDRAIADYDEAIRFDASDSLAFINRGLAYERKGENDLAIADYNEAIRLDPNDAFALNSRGIAYGMKGDYDRAIADFNKSILLDPKRAVAFGNRGLAYGRKGDYQRAIADFNEAIQLNPNDARAFCNRGNAKLKINDKSGDADIGKARELDAEICR